MQQILIALSVGLFALTASSPFLSSLPNVQPSSFSVFGQRLVADSGDAQKKPTRSLLLKVVADVVPGKLFDAEYQAEYEAIVDFHVQQVLYRGENSLSGPFPIVSEDDLPPGSPALVILRGTETILRVPFSLYTRQHDAERRGTKTLTVVLPERAFQGTEILVVSASGSIKYRIPVPALICGRECQPATKDQICNAVGPTAKDGICDPDCAMIEFGGITDGDCEAHYADVLCRNGELDDNEEMIDCGGVCGTECRCSPDAIMQLVSAAERGTLQFERIRAILSGQCGFTSFGNLNALLRSAGEGQQK